MSREEQLEQENADLRKQIESLNEQLVRLRATDVVFELVHGHNPPAAPVHTLDVLTRGRA